jgi:hypothetical protein
LLGIDDLEELVGESDILFNQIPGADQPLA